MLALNIAGHQSRGLCSSAIAHKQWYLKYFLKVLSGIFLNGTVTDSTEMKALEFLFVSSTSARWEGGAHWVSGLQLGNMMTIMMVLVEEILQK